MRHAVLVVLPNGNYDMLPDNVSFENEDVSAIIFPVISRDLIVQARYENMRIDGQSHRMAEMLATRTFPGVKTDAVFNEGKFSGDAGRVGAEEVWLREQAEAAGVSTAGKWYCKGVADFPGDPKAWIDSRGDVERIARERNLTVRGYVQHQGHEVEPMPDVDLADDIIENEVGDILESNPFANADEVREQVRAMRSGEIDPNPLRCDDYFTTDIP